MTDEAIREFAKLETPQTRYFELLYEAHAASEAVDVFDLREDDPSSLREWDRLCGESADAQHDLVEFCEQNGRRLRSLLAK